MFLLPNTSPYAQLTDLSCYTLTTPVPVLDNKLVTPTSFSPSK